MPDKQIISTAVRLKPETHAKILKLAKDSFRSISKYIEMIIIDYLEKLRKE